MFLQNKFFPKLNIYDQFGYLLVGGVSFLVLIFNLYLLAKLDLVPVFNTQTLIAWILAAYCLGHLLQAFANFFIKEKKSQFTESEKEILKRVNNHFKLKNQSSSQLFTICYMLASAKDITGHVKSFNAYYGLYRGWSIIFFLNAPFFLFLVVEHYFNYLYLIFFFSSVLLGLLFLQRSQRFYKYLRTKTLQTFLLLTKI